MSANKNYREITSRVSANMAKLRADTPDMMKGFAAMAGGGCGKVILNWES